MTTYAEPAQLSWRAIDWSTHEHWFEFEGRRLRYIDIGSGEDAVLFVRGCRAAGTGWLETLPAIAEHRRVIAIDLPGCGSSQMPARPLTLELWCEQLDALCEHLDLDRVTVDEALTEIVAAGIGVAYGWIVLPNRFDLPTELDRIRARITRDYSA